MTDARPDSTVPLHKRVTHPGPDVEGCYGCRIASLTLVVPIAFRGVR